MRLWDLLIEIGFAEIEVGFHCFTAGFDFIRRIIDEAIPNNVHIQMLCQARKELIERSLEALEALLIFHLYNSTSGLQRRVVFGMDRQGIIDLAVEGTVLVREGLNFSSNVTFEYSPESFTGTELDFALDICTAVADTWGATPEEPIIINLPSTVEMSTPNIYADQIEWFCRSFPRRDSAGDQFARTMIRALVPATGARVNGRCSGDWPLFGNGERTGNCDNVTMAMNLFSQKKLIQPWTLDKCQKFVRWQSR